MITRRDKLLKTPWEQRKFDNHLRKINSAVPVIDNKSPAARQHVAVKSKKRQKEIERMRQIENDNLNLLRRINYVMNTNRVDNWNMPPQQARYLRRVPFLTSSRRPATSTSTTFSCSSKHEDGSDAKKNHLRKSKCPACSPHITTPKPSNSERIPWEVPKMLTNSIGIPAARKRSKSLPVIKPGKIQIAKIDSAGIQKYAASVWTRGNVNLPQNTGLEQKHRLENGQMRKLTISRGSLKLYVKFPSDSHIVIQNESTEKTIFGSQDLGRLK